MVKVPKETENSQEIQARQERNKDKQGRRSGITNGGLEIKIQHFVCFSGKLHNKCFKP